MTQAFTKQQIAEMSPIERNAVHAKLHMGYVLTEFNHKQAREYAKASAAMASEASVSLANFLRTDAERDQIGRVIEIAVQDERMEGEIISVWASGAHVYPQVKLVGESATFHACNLKFNHVSREWEMA
jgi:hypothetical protein